MLSANGEAKRFKRLLRKVEDLTAALWRDIFLLYLTVQAHCSCTPDIPAPALDSRDLAVKSWLLILTGTQACKEQGSRMPHAAQSSRPLWSTLPIALLLLLYSSVAAATLNNVRQGGGSSTSIFSSSPASSHGSPDYTYLSTPSPEPQPAPPRFRLPYPRPDLYNVRTNLRHEVWKSSPERPVASTALTSAGQEGSRSTSSPPRKRPRLSANAPSPVWPKFAAPATLSQSRRSSPHSSPLSALTSLQSPAPSASHRSSSFRQQNSPPRLLAPADSKRKSKVMHLFSKGIGKIKGCFGAKKGRCE